GSEQDGPRTPRSLREVEAEGVSLLCSAALGLDGAEYSRGYLQHWLRGEEIAEQSCRRIFKAADAILRAGRRRNGRDWRAQSTARRIRRLACPSGRRSPESLNPGGV